MRRTAHPARGRRGRRGHRSDDPQPLQGAHGKAQSPRAPLSPTDPPDPLPIAVLVSGVGTTLSSLDEAIRAGRLRARIALVLADRPKVGAIERAKAAGLPARTVVVGGEGPSAAAGEIDRALRAARVELVVLAGFLSILPAELVAGWAGRIINVHPSLLPKYGGVGFYGARVHAAVLAAGETETGATVHLVTDDVDGGTILAQARIPVAPGDTVATLRERLGPVEKALLIETIGRFAAGALPLPYRAPARG